MENKNVTSIALHKDFINKITLHNKAKNKFTDITDSLNDVVKVIMRND